MSSSWFVFYFCAFIQITGHLFIFFSRSKLRKLKIVNDLIFHNAREMLMRKTIHLLMILYFTTRIT